MVIKENINWKTDQVKQWGSSHEVIKELLNHGFRYALSLTHHQAGAEDILQEAWLAIIKANGPHNKAYLYTAIRSRFYNQFKREKLIQMVPLDESHENESADSAEQVAIFEEIGNEDIVHALASLRVIEREVLMLAVVEEFTASEIADLTGHSRGTVLSLIHRSKKKIVAFVESKATVMEMGHGA